MSHCACCGRRFMGADPAVARPLHFDCWSEHHSSPLASEHPWPPGHVCADEATRPAHHHPAASTEESTK